MTPRLLPWLLWALFGCAGCSVVGEVGPAMDAPADCVVFDIDGTLTPKVSAIHTARDGAATAVKTFADAGYQVIYVSARIQLFRIYTEVESHARSRAELAMSGNSLTMSVQT